MAREPTCRKVKSRRWGDVLALSIGGLYPQLSQMSADFLKPCRFFTFGSQAISLHMSKVPLFISNTLYLTSADKKHPWFRVDIPGFPGTLSP